MKIILKSSIKNFIKLIRIHQYVKNLFIFTPLFFASKLTDKYLLANAFIAFIAFSLVASTIYVMNDYVDIEDDRLHPKKKFRPLASGDISKAHAIVIMTAFFIFGFILMFSVSPKASLILFIYLIINIAYSLRLKHIAILDVTIIALGFVLRVLVGSMVTDIPLSSWIIVMTFLLTLFLAMAKRRDDVLIFLDTGKKMRKVVDGYNLQLVDTTMAITASVVIVAYINYTTSLEVLARVNTEYLYLSSLFVVMGIMRYLQLTFVMQNSGSPTKIVLQDGFIKLTIVGWLLYFAVLLY